MQRLRLIPSEPQELILVSYPDNSFDDSNSRNIYVPELWAKEALLALHNNMVATRLVYTDYSKDIQRFGDTVNCRRPGTFTAKRKGGNDDITVQAASVTSVPVVLNQWLHTSFLIRDGDETMGFVKIRDEQLIPAVESIATFLDQMVLTQCYQFLTYNAGKLQTDPTKTTLIAAKEVMTNNKVPMSGRNLILSPDTEGDLLNVDAFTEADKVGDAGTALREGSLGRKFGFNTFTCQQVPSLDVANCTVVTRTINNGNVAAGSTVLTVDSATALTVGSWVTIAGDMIPHLVTASSSTSVTIYPALKYAIVDGAVVTNYDPGAINLSAGYDIGEIGALVVNGLTTAPLSGQLLSTGLTSARKVYGAMGTPTTTSVIMDRPLDAAVVNAAVVGVGPAGNYNFAFHRNALALVTRPLALPPSNMGVSSAIADANGVGIRVTMGYNMEKQGTLVTVDLLAGVKVLDERLGCVVFS